MGRIILLLLLSVGAFAQSPRPLPVYSMYGAHIIAWQPAPIPGYTKINARYQWIAGAFDSTLSVPYGTTASLRTLGYNAPGALFFQTSDSSLYAYTGTQWRVVSGGWLTTGNSGTDTSTNFIGTTDDKPLRIKVNNQQAGLILNNSPWNTFWGYGAGKSNTTGNINVGVGWGALRDNVTGSSNTAIGLGAIQNATNASEEVAIGYGALGNISGQRNVAVGTSAMVNSRDAAENTAVGNYVMLANRQGDNNNAFGSSALRGNADGGSNVGLGNISLTQNTTAFYAVSVTSGGSGYAAGDTVLIVSAPVVASDPNNNSLQAVVRCTVVAGVVTSARIIEPGKGYSSYAPPTATLSGSGTGATFSISLTSGEYNTATGVGSLSANRTGKNNTAYGYAAGAGIDTGINNTFIGTGSGYTGQLSNARNTIAIGVNAITTGHNQFVISDSITSYKLPNIPSGVGTKSVRYDPSTGLLSYADTTTGGGGSGVTTLAAIGSSPNANGATISGSTLNLEPASASFGGVVTTGTQTFAGAKTFNGNVNITTAGNQLSMFDGTFANTSVNQITWGSNYNGPALILNDFGAGSQIGWGLRAGAQIFYMPNNIKFTVNESGSFPSIGTGERFAVDIPNAKINLNYATLINTSGGTPAASAQLEVTSTTKGFLPPRMTATQAEAISSPAEGLMIYSTDGSGSTITSKGWWGYDGSAWVKLN